MVLAVTGSRAVTEAPELPEELERLKGRVTELLHGGAAGPDTLAGRWAVAAGDGTEARLRETRQSGPARAQCRTGAPRRHGACLLGWAKQGNGQHPTESPGNEEADQNSIGGKAQTPGAAKANSDVVMAEPERAERTGEAAETEGWLT